MQFQMPNFAELDKNKDKKISRDEMPSQFPPQIFDRWDTNKDGFVDEEEFNALPLDLVVPAAAREWPKLFPSSLTQITTDIYRAMNSPR